MEQEEGSWPLPLGVDATPASAAASALPDPRLPSENATPQPSRHQMDEPFKQMRDSDVLGVIRQTERYWAL
eukprot:1310461-Rhodomonas_salina.3